MLPQRSMWRPGAIRKVAPLLLFVSCLLAGSCSRAPTSPNDASWRVLPGHVEPFSDPNFRAGRKCWVYLPPSYQASTDRYPVLYVTDGEDVFDAGGHMHVNRICEDLIRQGEIRPIIVVAIENATREQRFWELVPVGGFYNGQGGGREFLLGIRDTLKSAIDRHYRTLPDSANTAIAGVSLGGLFAGYAGLLCNRTFGNVAAFSPSYWVDSNHLVYIADSLRFDALPRRIRRYYQDTGTGGDNYIEGMTQVLLRDGFQPGVNFLSITAVDGEHAYSAWEHRYPEMLKFLFPRDSNASH